MTLLGYVTQFTSVFHDMAWQYNQIVQYNTDVETAKEIEGAYAAHHRPDTARLCRRSGRRSRLAGLRFSHREVYDGERGPQSLHGISLQLPRGKRVALVGESGCGKTTLLALLRGLYEPEPGVELRVDGRPL